jgi:hypothetical protein
MLRIVGIITALSVVAVQSEFQCFNDSVRAKITFKNNPDKEVPDLWTVRIMQGTYASQWALEYGAYMFMREMLGINATFYPTDDPDAAWGLTDGTGAGYPANYFAWLKNDEMDINYEFWPLQAQAANATQYYLEGSVDFGGFVGAYGEIAWYIPGYLVDEYPTIIVPFELKNNTAFRNMFIQGSMNGSVNWIDYYNHTECYYDNAAFTSAGIATFNFTQMRAVNITYAKYNVDTFNVTGLFWDAFDVNSSTVSSSDFEGCVFNDTMLQQDLANTSLSTRNVNEYISEDAFSRKFDIPGGDRPIIWGSYDSYAMSKYSYNLTRNLLGGLDWDFSTTDSEALLADMVKDLYSRRQPFIANIYPPDPNFATIDAVSGELQQFEKVALPRNPDQSVEDECYLNAVCQNPVEPIMKAANPLLKERFPEAYDFFVGYTLTTTQVNTIISYYMQLADSGLSEKEKWLNASCEWLKDSDSESAWNNAQWLIDIARYDCLAGCGVAYNGDENNKVGGQCDYFTGTCECDYAELFSDTNCTESCPGLSDPYYNGTDYVFDFCSGHGTCDIITRLCACDKGYGGDGCETKYAEYAFDAAIGGTLMAVSCLLIAIAIGCIAWLRINAEYKTVKALSVDMTTLFSLGLLCLCGSNIALVSPVTSATCISWQWLFGLGGILSIMSPLLKAYRVSRVFHGGKMLRAVKITDKMLMGTLLKAALVEIIICGAYSFSHEQYGGTFSYYNDEELRVDQKCNEDKITSYLALGSYAYFFVMLCALTYYSYGTRRALSVFKESTCAYFSSFLSLFCTLLTFVFSMATSDPTFRGAVQCAAITIVVTAVLALFYGTRIFTFITDPENRNTTDTRTPTHTTTSFTNSNREAEPAPEASA